MINSNRFRFELEEGQIVLQETCNGNWRLVKLTYFGDQGEWYGKVIEGESKGANVSFENGDRIKVKLKNPRYSDEELYMLCKMDMAVLPWAATRL